MSLSAAGSAAPSPKEIAQYQHEAAMSIAHYQLALKKESKAKSRLSDVSSIIASLHEDIQYRTRRAREQRIKQLDEPHYIEDLRSSQGLTRMQLDRSNTAIERHRKLACRALCEMVQEKLPRELRNMVYEFLLRGESWLEPQTPYTFGYAPESHICCCFGGGFSSHKETESYRGWPKLPDGIHCLRRMPQHLQCPETLGLETFAEFAEMWYRTAQPVFPDYNTFSCFLTSDRFHLRLNPAQLLSQVDIVLQQRHCRPDDLEIALNNGKECLKQIWLLKSTAVISIIILACRTEYENLWLYVEMLASLQPTLNEVEARGYSITVSTKTFRGVLPNIFFDNKTRTVNEWNQHVKYSLALMSVR